MTAQSVVSADLLLERAKRLQHANRAIASELSLLRSDEHAIRHRILTMDHPLIHRWCQDADVFLREKDIAAQAAEDYNDTEGVTWAHSERGASVAQRSATSPRSTSASEGALASQSPASVQYYRSAVRAPRGAPVVPISRSEYFDDHVTSHIRALEILSSTHRHQQHRTASSLMLD